MKRNAERYLVVSSSGDPERDALVVHADLLRPAYDGKDRELNAAIVRRMLAAGVEVISNDEWQRRRVWRV